MQIVCKIDVKKIDKAQLYVGTRGTYLDIALVENKEGVDKYGNAGFVAQSISKEARGRGERGPIIGNWKRLGERAEQPARTPIQPSAPAGASGSGGDPTEDIPFSQLVE